MVLGCGRVESVELLSGQPDRDDLRWFGPSTGTAAAPTHERVDVVASSGLVGPLLDLVIAHRADIA